MLALPGGLALLVVPAIVYFLLPESRRWHLRRGEAQIAVDIVNRIIGAVGNRVPPLTVWSSAMFAQPPRDAAALPGLVRQGPAALDRGRRGCRHVRRLRCFMIAALLPKALTDQGYAVGVSLGITSIIYATSFFGKASPAG